MAFAFLHIGLLLLYAMKKIFNTFRQSNHRHFVAIGLILVSSLLGVFAYSMSYQRLLDSFLDVLKSFFFYFKKTFMGIDESIDIFSVDKITSSGAIYVDVEKIKEGFSTYFQRLFNWDNFSNYSMDVLYWGIIVLSVLSLFVPVIILLISRIKAIYLTEGEEESKNTDTKPLKVFKAKFEPALIGVKNWLSSLVEFISSRKIYSRSLLVLWLLNLNILSILSSLVAFYFYFVSSFAFASFPDFLLEFVIDSLIMFNGLPIIFWFAFGYKLLLNILKKRAYAVLEHHEMKNRGFINAQPLGTLGCATMGAGKTSLSVDMALSTSVMFKDKALEILIKCDMKYPNFPWLRFEDDLKRCYTNHLKRQEQIKKKRKRIIKKTDCIYNLASSKYWVISKAQRFLKNPCKDNLWGYDFEKYRTEYDDDLTVTDLFETLITYSKAYLIYVTQSSLIFGNLSVREDIFCDNGYLPMWCTDFFHRSPAESMQTSRFAKIIDFDMLRLGKKMVEDNRLTGAFEFGVVVLTEIGKERGNALENREFKKKDDNANATNDGFEDTVKMIRHRATVDFFPFVRIISDEQRAESLGANTRDTFSVIQIVDKSELKVLYKGLFFDGFIHDIFYPKFRSFYLKMRNLRGDNTLLVYLLKNLFAFTENRYTKLENRFGYYVLDFETTTGRLDNVPTQTKYYLSRKKTFSGRFATDCYGDFFERMAQHSGVGIMDFLSYKDVQQTEDEMQLQNSYFYVKMSLYTQFSDV